MEKYVDCARDQVLALCNIPSPSGYTRQIETYLVDELTKMGYAPTKTNKNAVLCHLGGEGDGLLLAAHVDTLGLMVSAIKANGRLLFTRVGGFPLQYVESENVDVHTRGGKTYQGTVRLNDPAVHNNAQVASAKREYDTMEIVLDEKVATREDTENLGVCAGDYVSLCPRTVVSESGYIKSRHLDDKASSGVLLALARYIADAKMPLKRAVYVLFTTYEEVGHGGTAGHPEGITEMLSVDMGVVGENVDTDETCVSICPKDSAGPYDYDMTTALIELARKEGLHYAVDVYAYYSSDAQAAMKAGLDYRHALIGPGVAASHGYERTHVEGLSNTLKLILAYLG